MTDQQIRERCVRHIHMFQAQIDMHGWSDDLCIEILESLYREAMAAGLERAAVIAGGGGFISETSAEARFGKACAGAIRTEAQRVKEGT